MTDRAYESTDSGDNGKISPPVSQTKNLRSLTPEQRARFQTLLKVVNKKLDIGEVENILLASQQTAMDYMIVTKIIKHYDLSEKEIDHIFKMGRARGIQKCIKYQTLSEERIT